MAASRVLAAVTGPGVPAAVDRRVLLAVTGEPIAEVEYVPPLLVQAVLDRMAAAEQVRAPAQEIFDDAAKLLESAELDGLTVLATGLPSGTVERGLAALGDGLRGLPAAAAAERPPGISEPGHRVVWVPRAPTLGVVASSNHPEPHPTWVRALSYGCRVVVRPGGRDPFTPLRLAAALLAAGLPPDRPAVPPGDHATTALRRVVQPSEVADAVLHLAGLSAVTGQTLVIDGGRVLR